MKNKLLVTPAPHITRHLSTAGLMYVMLVALIPSAISGVVVFGMKALYMILISVLTGYTLDLLFRYLVNKNADLLDISGDVSGFITALILPVSAPLYFPVIANFI